MATDTTTPTSPSADDPAHDEAVISSGSLRVRIEHALRPWRRANPGARYMVMAGSFITLVFLILAIFADVIAPFGQSQYCADEYYTNDENTSGVCDIPADVADAEEARLLGEQAEALAIALDNLDPDLCPSSAGEGCTVPESDAEFVVSDLQNVDSEDRTPAFESAMDELAVIDTLLRRPGETPPRIAPNSDYPMGTTRDRLDVLSRVILGARLAFAVVAFSTAFAMFIGVPLGLFSGYIGGKFDRIMVLLMDTIYAFPSLLLAILIAFALRVRLEQADIEAPFLPAAIAVGFVYIPQYFRVIRNHTLSVKEEPYVEAARSLGATRSTIVFRYIFFNVVSSIPVLFTLNAADAVLTMAGLGFLGYGVTFPTAEWGLDVNLGLADSVAGFWWTAFWPGVAITLLVTGLSLMGEGLNDIINPLLRVKGYRGKVKANAREAVQLAASSDDMRDSRARDRSASGHADETHQEGAQ